MNFTVIAIEMTRDANYVAGMETWALIPGYEDYEVSSLGRVRSLDRTVPTRLPNGRWTRRRVAGRILVNQKDNNGYPMVTIRERRMRVHVIEMLAFCGPRPVGTQVCHCNDVPADNRLSNLRYDTPRANHLDAVHNGKASKPPRSKQQKSCKRGHEFTRENTIVEKRGSRKCRICWNAYQRERNRQKRAG